MATHAFAHQPVSFSSDLVSEDIRDLWSLDDFLDLVPPRIMQDDALINAHYCPSPEMHLKLWGLR